MAKVATGTTSLGSKSGVRIVVAGDRGTGKSSLMVTAATDNFPVNVPPVLPPTRLPEDFYPDRIPVLSSILPPGIYSLALWISTVEHFFCLEASSSGELKPTSKDRVEDSGKVAEELKRADAVVLTYACDKPETLDRLSTFWLPELRRLEIPEVFYYAQKAVLHPTGPLFDQESQTLKPSDVSFLHGQGVKIKPGLMGLASSNGFWLDIDKVKCFNAPLQPSEIVGVKRVVEEKLPEKGRLETTWTVLRKFGYNNDIKLADELIPTFKRAPDQSVELTNETIEFLKGIYELFDSDYPWDEAPYKDAAEKTALGGLSVSAFLCEWALMTLLDPSRALENLIYIGYPGDPSAAVRITRRRRLDRKKQQSERNVFQCFVFGPKNAGKSALLNSFTGRRFVDTSPSTTGENYAVNVVDLPGLGIKKTLILREIPEDGVKKLLSNKESLAPCDIAVFVHDSSDESSWRRATELLVEVASHGEDTGYEVPCLIVAAKDDLNSFPMAIQESTRVSQDMGIEAPIPISSKMGDTNNIFRRIVNAAEHPHLSIPETEAGRSRKQYHRLINRSLMFVSVGAAVAIVGLAAYRVYATRKNTSG
ncbi:hypothetical protein GH714_025582 [Hevea brasiliensis]|uniref:Mitochondrial Rho GTPase n=1 Tax=Hevea brasiliensis TaxID=3981 RepID=A0A6A6M4K9_HEVBR|nr:hypothetical protein GH714_025582 [Hevea brasiliensis]